jgi:hypothetical protein
MYKKLQRFRKFLLHKKNRHRRTVTESVLKNYGTHCATKRRNN